MIEVVPLLRAEIDIQEAYARYENASEGRGDSFASQLEREFDLISNFPEIGRVYTQNYRRKLVRGFPYAIFYTVQPTRVFVAAVLDIRQDPDTILRRLLQDW
jgi:plasmid stabilization system protein ParE